VMQPSVHRPHRDSAARQHEATAHLHGFLSSTLEKLTMTLGVVCLQVELFVDFSDYCRD
jgi:hypothetical protein